MHLTLIGLRGTGKSTVGRLVAERLGWTFVDADEAIVERAGRSIAEIFATDGEAVFRVLEVDTIADLLSGQTSTVIAAGGGAVLSEQTRSRMRNAGPVVWLTASLDVLGQRLLADEKTASQRPSLTGQDVADELAEVLKTRRPLYQQTATITAPTDAETVEQLADDIVNRLANELGLRVESGAGS